MQQTVTPDRWRWPLVTVNRLPALPRFFPGFSIRVHRQRLPSVAVKLSDAGFLDPGKGVEAPTSVATKSSNPWPVNPEDESNTPQSAVVKPPGSRQVHAEDEPKMPPLTTLKSSGPGPLHPIAGTAASTPTGGRPDASPNPSTIDGMAQSPQGALMPQRGSTGSPGDGSGPDLDFLKLDENAQISPDKLDETAQTSPEDARVATGLPSGAGLAMPLGNTKDEGRHGVTTAPVLPAVTSAKSRDGVSGSRVRGHRLSDEILVPAVRAAVSQGVPDAASTSVGLAFQQPAGMVNMPATVSPPLPDTVVTIASDQVVATASQIKVGGGGKPADPHQSAPADPGKTQPDSADHPAGATSPPAVLPAATEKIVTRSDVVPETPAPTMRAEVPQTPLAGTAPTAVSQTDQAPPAAPAEQVAPALVAVLQNDRRPAKCDRALAAGRTRPGANTRRSECCGRCPYRHHRRPAGDIAVAAAR